MNVATLVGIMIAIIIGVNLIPAGVSVAEGEEASSLTGILTIIFVAVVMLGAVAWISFLGEKKFPNGESSSKVATAIGTYVKEHKKLCLAILASGVIVLLLQLSTYLGRGIPT